jgi:hypothetical protein
VRELKALIAFAVTYVLIAARRLPLLRIGRPTLALAGAVAMVAVGVLTPAEAFGFVDLRTLALLFGMMVISGYLDEAGFFAALTRTTLWRTWSPETLLDGVVWISGLAVNHALLLLVYRRRLRPAGAAAGAAVLVEEASPLPKGQTLYGPVYSHVYWGTKPRTFDPACTLSVRNIDPAQPIPLTGVDYCNTEGKKIRAYLAKPVTIAPLDTKEYYLEEEDTAGGSGANFLVKRASDRPVNPPIVECVMIGVEAAQGGSFTSRGRVILESPPR